MTKKTRNFVLGAAGILAAGLTTGLVASLGLPVAMTRAAGPAELEYIPTDAMAVGFANVQEVMASELRQRLRKLEPDTTERDDFETKTGVDIERDIDSVVGAMLPTAAAGDDDHRPLVIARGRFDQVRIEGLAQQHGGQVQDYQGVRLLTHADGDKRVALGFLEPGVLAVGAGQHRPHATGQRPRRQQRLGGGPVRRAGQGRGLGGRERPPPADPDAVVVLGRRPPERRNLGVDQGRSQGRRGRRQPA
jgi:hypothetical protein